MAEDAYPGDGGEEVERMMVDGIDIKGFSEPVPVSELWTLRYRAIPKEHGVYLVRRLSTCSPVFLLDSGAGWFKGENPSYPYAVVETNWVPQATIVYVGKAAGANGLRQRLCQLIDFGYGKPVGHRGGRMLWHLADWQTLHLQWRVCPPGEAECLESALIDQFRQKYGVRPFANMSK